MPKLAARLFWPAQRPRGHAAVRGYAHARRSEPRGPIWGVGPVFQLPTDTNDLGNKNWGMGASAVVLKLEKGGPWVYGVLVNNVWSLSSSKRGGTYSNGIVQPFVNHDFPEGFHLTRRACGQ